MNTYMFLTGEEYTFEPETEGKRVEIESLQLIGLARGSDAIHAYRNLLADNPHLQEKQFEKIFCYQVDEMEKQDRGILN